VRLDWRFGLSGVAPSLPLCGRSLTPGFVPSPLRHSAVNVTSGQTVTFIVNVSISRPALQAKPLI
jgi:hypothetical protein